MNTLKIVLLLMICSVFFAGNAIAVPFRGEVEEETNLEYLPAILLLLLDGGEQVVVVANNPPNADPGSGDVTNIGVILLDGSGSVDPDNDTLSFIWRLANTPPGSAAELINPSSPQANLIPDIAGRYELTLTVNDGQGGLQTRNITYVYLPCEFELQRFEIGPEDAPRQNDEIDQFTPLTAGFVGQPLVLDTSDESLVEVFYTDLNGDLQGDVITRAPGDSVVRVWLSDQSGSLQAPQNLSFGTEPITAMAVGRFIGGGLADIALGDASGQVMLFEGQADGFLIQPALAFTENQSIFALQAIDVGDGTESNDALIVAVETGVSVRRYTNVQSQRPVIQNGEFDLTLASWQTEIVGQAGPISAGAVELLGGRVNLREGRSFRVTLQQEFMVPDEPGVITFDLLDIQLDESLAGIPDAFEVSLLSLQSSSLVPTIEPAATSFLNINPGGRQVLASGVTQQGTEITVDISAVPPNTRAVLYFDLIGHPPQSDSWVTLDNVDAGIARFDASLVDIADVSGGYTSVDAIGACDLSGDSALEVLVRDQEGAGIVILSENEDGDYEPTQSISLTGVGEVVSD